MCLYLGDAQRVTIDCQGYELKNSNGSTVGIYVGNKTNADKVEYSGIVIKNCVIEGFDEGFLIREHGVTLLQNTIVNAEKAGIMVVGTQQQWVDSPQEILWQRKRVG